MPQFKFINVTQKALSFRLVSLPAALLAEISYAAVRRKDDEDGAVQRVLNGSRISGVREFALKQGDFPASIVLNWVGDPLAVDGDLVEIPDIKRSAQILDGQHRVAGIKAAMQQEPDVGLYEIPVAIYEGLDNPNSARIFISINTEQRPAPKSLVFDLYGLAASDLLDPSALRAADIVTFLGSRGEAFDGWIKLPNQERQRGGVALSTAVSAIKTLVAEKGPFEQIGATSLEMQKVIFSNYFSALKAKYGSRWADRSNAFIYASGFLGAVDFFRTHVFDYCKNQKSFEIVTILNCFNLDETDLILQEEVKGLGGTEAANAIHERLLKAFQPSAGLGDFKV